MRGGRKFRRKDRVVISREAVEKGIGPSGLRGVVVGTTSLGLVVVHMDGRKQPDEYHPDFVETR